MLSWIMRCYTHWTVDNAVLNAWKLKREKEKKQNKEFIKKSQIYFNNFLKN